MRFGGYSSFGGASGFGGMITSADSQSRFLSYHRMLKDLLPPGAYTNKEDSVIDMLVRLDAKGLGDIMLASVDALEREGFITKAEETLAEWEELLDIVPGVSDTVDERRDNLLTVWRGGCGCTLPDFRKLLDKILNSSTAFRDSFPGDDLSYRWLGNEGYGHLTVLSGEIILSIDAVDDCDWLTTAKILYPPWIILTEENDVYRGGDTINITTHCTQLDPPNDDTASGLFIMGHKLWYDLYYLGYYVESGKIRVQVDKFEEGVLTRDVMHSDWTTLPATLVPGYLLIVVDESLISFYYLVDPATTYTLLGSVSKGLFTTKTAGLYAQNRVATKNALAAHYDEFYISYGQSYNNIEIVENKACPFYAFIHREPTDSGTYQLSRAQHLMNKLKYGHTLITVGESDCFLCDDDYSLTDRDILGF